MTLIITWINIIRYSVLLNLTRFQDNKITIRELLIWNKWVGPTKLLSDLRTFWYEENWYDQQDQE